MANTVPMNERNIAFFPMQSAQIDTDELGNPIYDNAADAEILQNLRMREIKDGVYPDVSTYLQVMSNNNMTVVVKAGYAHMRGVEVWIKEDITLTAETADPIADRVDRVVLRYSYPDRDINVFIKKGDATLTRIAGTTWELGLADLAVAHMNAVISQAEITDLRLDPSACGIVSGLVQIDTGTIFNQYMARWQEIQSGTTGVLIGESKVWPSKRIPVGWLAHGQSVSRATYANLFNVVCYPAGNPTISIASPGVLTLNSHGYITGDPVFLTTTGALPTGLAANTLYYAIYLTANTFKLATSRTNALAGTAINTSGSQSGTHTIRDCPWGIADANTFNLPPNGVNFVGRDGTTEFNNIGQTGGDKNLAAHDHTIRLTADGSIVASNMQFGNPGGNTTRFQKDGSLGGNGGTGAGLSGTTGTGTAGNLPPYAVTNWIIKY